MKLLYISDSLVFMHRIVVLVIIICLTSCNRLNVKKTSSETIIEEELKTFNWNEVDEYPTFSSCDSSHDAQSKKVCFEETLTTAIYNHFVNEHILVTQDISDTVLIQFLISQSGDLQVVNTQMDSITKIEIPNIEILINQSLEALPKIYPAIKRSQPVKTQFTLPILIEVN